MNRLKQLNEQAGAKLKELDALRSAAKDRAFTAEERTKFDGLSSEIEGLNTDISGELRAESLKSTKPVEVSKSERRALDSFNIAIVLRHMQKTFKGQPTSLDGVERELLVEGENEARSAGIQDGGVFLPRCLVRRQGFQPGGSERRDMSVTGGTTTQYGGYLVPTAKMGLADDFYNASVLRQAGATVLEGLVGNLDLPRYAKATNPTKKAENATADELSPTVAKLSLSPRRLPAYIDISDQLTLQSPEAIEAFLRRALVSQLTDVQEVAFFHGGGTNEPTGIAGTSGIGSVAGGTNGAAPTDALMIDLETAVANNNAEAESTTYFTNTRVRGKLKKTLITATYGDQKVWGRDGLLNGYKPYVTNAVSNTLTKGSASGVCSAIFFGNARDFIIGYWGGMSLELVRDKTNAISGLTTLVASAYYDGGVYRPKSWAAMLDALTT